MRSITVCSTLILLFLPMPCSAQHQSSGLTSQIDQIMRARGAVGEFNGSVLVARRGHIIYERGFGLANLEWHIPNDVNTKFEIGSMTKQFTALLRIPTM